MAAASLSDEEGDYALARAALEAGPGGLTVEHLRWDEDFRPTRERPEAIFVGGGNTYALLQRLRESGLLEEGTMLRVEGGVATVAGTGRVKLFLRGRKPSWLVAGQEVALDLSGK